MVEVEKLIKSYRKKIRIINSSVLDINSFVKDFNPKTGSACDLTMRKTSLNSLKKQFHHVFDEYIEVLDEKDITSDVLDILKEFENHYFAVMSSIEAFLEHLCKTTSTQGSSCSTN
jgi:hypothetical protein